MARSKTVWRNGKVFAEYVDGQLVWLDPEYKAPARSTDVKAPMYMRDIGEYVSPIDGSYISTRSAHRDHMRAHDVIEVGNERLKATPVEEPVGFGQAIKQRLDEVKAMPQRDYDEYVQKQVYEHSQIAAVPVAAE